MASRIQSIDEARKKKAEIEESHQEKESENNEHSTNPECPKVIVEKVITEIRHFLM